MGEATEGYRSPQPGPGIGGLLNVTFGYVLLADHIAFFALIQVLQEVVKASIRRLDHLSSAGHGRGDVRGWLAGAEKQTFSQTAAHAQSAMPTLALVALVFPAIFQLSTAAGCRRSAWTRSTSALTSSTSRLGWRSSF